MSFPSTLSNVTNGATKPIVQQQQRMFQHRAPTTTINPFARFTNSSLSQLETIQRNQHRNNTHNNHQHRRNFNANSNKLARVLQSLSDKRKRQLKILSIIGGIFVLLSSLAYFYYAKHVKEAIAKHRDLPAWDFSIHIGDEWQGYYQLLRQFPSVYWDNLKRFSRSALTVFLIAKDYGNLKKLALFGNKTEEELAEEESNVHKRSALRLLNLFIHNGGIYLKAGQIICSADHVLPREYTETMRPCCDRAKWYDYNEVEKIFIDKLGHPPDYYFSEFSREPIAAASLAQVHKARLKPTGGEGSDAAGGEYVAVKVQYPHVKERMKADVVTIHFLTKVIEWVFPEFQFGWLLREFEDHLPEELNFMNEAQNCERAGKILTVKDVTTPKIHWNITCGEIITMEFIEGVKIDDLQGLKQIGADPKRVSRLLTEAICEQMFLQGFIHCDAHPGNIVVRKKKNGKGCELVLLDHGLYMNLPNSIRLDYCKLWYAATKRDFDTVNYYCQKLGIDNYEVLLSLLVGKTPPPPQNATDGAPLDRTAALKLLVGTAISGDIRDHTEEEKQSVRSYANKHLKGIVATLNKIPKQMVLLFKSMDLLRSVQNTMGVPINYFTIMALYSLKGIQHDAYLANPGFTQRVRHMFELWALRVNLYFISLSIRLMGYFAK